MLTPAPTTRVTPARPHRRRGSRGSRPHRRRGSHPGRAPTGDHEVLEVPHVCGDRGRASVPGGPHHIGSTMARRGAGGNAGRRRRRLLREQRLVGAQARADSRFDRAGPCTSTPVPNTPPAASSRSRSMHGRIDRGPGVRRSDVRRRRLAGHRLGRPAAAHRRRSATRLRPVRSLVARLANRWSRRSTTTRRGTRRRPRRRTARIAPVGPASWRRMCSRSGSKTAA